MHTVEIFHRGRDVVGPMTQMREWLDSRRVTPGLFIMSPLANGIAFRLQFATPIEAAVAAHALGGRVIADETARAA
jgi:hypothetical protein